MVLLNRFGSIFLPRHIALAPVAAPNKRVRPWVIVVLTALCVGGSAIAQQKGGQTIIRPGPKTPPAPTKPNFGDDRLEFLETAREPESADEYWRAIDYELNFGKPEKASRFIRSLLALKDVNAQTLLDLRDRYGSTLLIQMSVRPELGAPAKQMLKMINEAAVAHLRDPVRLKRFIGNLEKSESERIYAIEQLKQAGEFAVGPLAEAIVESPNKPGLTLALAQLPPQAWEAVAALLTSNNPDLQTAAATALARYQAKESVEELWYAAHAKSLPNQARSAAALGLAKLTSAAKVADPRDAADALARIADDYYLHRAPRDLSFEQYDLWTWTNGKLGVSTIPSATAERKFGLLSARRSLELDPNSLSGARSLLSLVLDESRKAVLPDDVKPFASPAALTAVFEKALQDRRPHAAQNAVTLIQEFHAPHAAALLNRAVNFPDKRVQFTAAMALLAGKPGGRSSNSERIVPILLRAVGTGEGRSVVVADPYGNRANQTASLASQMGYTVHIAKDGREAFRLASTRGDVELLLIEPSLQGPPVGDLLTQLAADTRTLGLPAVVFAIDPPDYTPAEIRRPLTEPEVEAIRKRQRHQALLEEMKPDMFAYAVLAPERESRVFSATERVDYLLKRLGLATDPAELRMLTTEPPTDVAIVQKSLLDPLEIFQIREWYRQQQEMLEGYRRRHPNVVVAPHFDRADLFSRYLRLTLGKSDSEPFSSEESAAMRTDAYAKLLEIAQGVHPSLRIDDAVSVLSAAMSTSADGAKAAEVLGYLPSPIVQSRLNEQATATLQREAVRIAAAKALKMSVIRVGRRLPISERNALIRGAALEPAGPVADAMTEAVGAFGAEATRLLEALRKRLGPVPPRSAPAREAPAAADAEKSASDTMEKAAPPLKGAKGKATPSQKSKKAADDSDL